MKNLKWFCIAAAIFCFCQSVSYPAPVSLIFSVGMLAFGFGAFMIDCQIVQKEHKKKVDEQKKANQNGTHS